MDRDRAKLFENSIDAVRTIIDTSIAVISFSPVQIALATVSAFLTFVKYISGFEANPGEELADKLNALEGQLFNFKHTLEWESSRALYHEEFTLLRYVRRKLVAMRCMKDDDEKEEHLRELKGLALKMRLASLLEALGIEDNNVLDFDILLNYYKYSNGHRSQLALLSLELMGLIMSGISALYLIRNLTEEKSTRAAFKNSSDSSVSTSIANIGVAGIETNYYIRKLKIAKDNIKRVLEKCKEDCKDNMEQNIKKYFGEANGKKSNTAMVKEIVTFLAGKYDWLEVACTVYTEKIKDCIICPSRKSDIAVNLDENCCVVFVREILCFNFGSGSLRVETDKEQSISPEVDDMTSRFLKKVEI